MKRAKAGIEDVYSKMNIMQRHAMVGGFAQDVIRKLGTDAITKEREREIFNKGFAEGVNASVAVMMNMYWNYWKDTLPKSSRLKAAYELFTEKLSKLHAPDDKQMAAEAEFKKQTGAEFVR